MQAVYVYLQISAVPCSTLMIISQDSKVNYFQTPHNDMVHKIILVYQYHALLFHIDYYNNLFQITPV